METSGYVVASSNKAQIFGQEHQPVLKEGDLVAKKSWLTCVSKLQVIATNTPMLICRKYHVMPGEKRCGALDSCFGLVALISRAYSLWHHEFITAKMSAALVVLN